MMLDRVEVSMDRLDGALRPGQARIVERDQRFGENARETRARLIHSGLKTFDEIKSFSWPVYGRSNCS